LNFTLCPGLIVNPLSEYVEFDVTARGCGTVSEKVGEWIGAVPVLLMRSETVDV
jgi:hypothetical protein